MGLHDLRIADAMRAANGRRRAKDRATDPNLLTDPETGETFYASGTDTAATSEESLTLDELATRMFPPGP